MFSKVLFVALTLIGSLALADEETRDAVAKAQADLRRPGFARESAKDSPAAAKVSAQVEALTGAGPNADAVYDLTADILGKMKDMTPEEMMKVVEQAQKDPAAFARNFTPEQKEKLHALSERIPAGQRKQP